MQVTILYAIVVLIWGTTWIAITYQLGDVATELSVAYRFALASALLFAYAFLTGRRISIPRRIYPYVLIMGTMMFSAGYLFIYHASAYITSGLVAVIFSLVVVSNGLYERLFFKTPLEPRLMLATLFGLSGIALMFWPEVSSFTLQDQSVIGMLFVLMGVLLGSFGTMAAIVCTREQLPVITVNAHAMAWGALASFVVAVILGRPINFSLEPSYVLSLAYLAIFGSAVAFGCFLALIRQIGSARTAYSSILYPIVALLISTFVEDYQWSVPAFAGIGMIATGNWLALTKFKKRN